MQRKCESSALWQSAVALVVVIVIVTDTGKGAWAVKPLTPIRTRDGGTSHKIVQSIRAAMQRGIQKRILLKHPQHICRFLRRRLRMELRLRWAKLRSSGCAWDSVTDSILYCFCFCLFVYHVRTYLTRPTNADTQQKYFSFRKVVRENRF